MPNQTADRLRDSIDKILQIWEERVNKEVSASNHQETLALRDSLPDYLLQLVDALSTSIDRTTARQKSDRVESSRIGRKHGKDRAQSKNYTIDQLITEYHILRQVLCDELEKEMPLTSLEREVIVCSVEQAVNDAATEFSDTLKKLKEKISSTLAHDLRGPLASSKMTAQILLKKLPSDDISFKKMQFIISNLNRIDQMITELLDVSRLQAGEGMPLEFEYCDLTLLTTKVIEEQRLSHPDRFIFKSEEKLFGYWDIDGIRRVIENLLANAVKHGDDTKMVTISLKEGENTVRLCVHNYGAPIPKDKVPVLFEEYKRLKSSEDKAGWGLGLAMVKSMVDAHQGSIEVESKEVEGTTFIVYLPKDARSVDERMNLERNREGSSQIQHLDH